MSTTLRLTSQQATKAAAELLSLPMGLGISFSVRHSEKMSATWT